MSNPAQTITVRVINQSNNTPIAGAQVIVRHNQSTIAQAVTDASGEAQFTLSHGTYTIQVSTANYQGRSVNVSIPLSDQVVTISLTPTQTFTVRLVEIRDNQTHTTASASVVIRQGQTLVASIYIVGESQLTLPHGSYSLEVISTIYRSVSMDITVPVPNDLIVIALQRLTQTITIRFINNANSAPIPNARVHILHGIPEITVASGVTNQQGMVSFTLEHGYHYYVETRLSYIIRTSFYVPHASGIIDVRWLNYLRLRVVDERNINIGVGDATMTVEGPNNFTSTGRTDRYGYIQF